MLDPAALTLIAITDDLRDGVDGITARAVAAVDGGATMIQLRLKGVDARTTTDVAERLVRTLSIPVLVNDRVDVALAAGAAGVHVGADDLPVAAVRRIVPPDFIIGASVGTESEVANGSAADYVGIGPVFETASKGDAGPAIGAERFAELARLCGRPAVAIGGIDAENARSVMDVGASGVAVIRAVFSARSPADGARALRLATGR